MRLFSTAADIHNLWEDHNGCLDLFAFTTSIYPVWPVLEWAKVNKNSLSGQIHPASAANLPDLSNQFINRSGQDTSGNNALSFLVFMFGKHGARARLQMINLTFMSRSLNRIIWRKLSKQTNIGVTVRWYWDWLRTTIFYSDFSRIT